MKYIDKHRFIEAIQWTGKNIYEIQEFAGDAIHDVYAMPDGTYSFMINTLGAKSHVRIGDYIYKIHDGSGFAVMLRESFEYMYEPLEETDIFEAVTKIVDTGYLVMKNELQKLIKEKM